MNGMEWNGRNGMEWRGQQMEKMKMDKEWNEGGGW